MILAIESSCDDSAVALFDPARGVVDAQVYRQTEAHEHHGGIVPDLAAREHLQQLGPLIDRVLSRLEPAATAAVAVTCGPGLAGCLALGIALAQALALALEVSLVGVNHLRGHAWSPFIPLYPQDPRQFVNHLSAYLPHLGLLVSGGNTLLFSIDQEHRFAVIAQTVDDAAGEALDKGAKLLGMPYPGGPIIERRALAGAADVFDFPRAFPQRSAMRFSFSGLKTSLRYRLEAMSDQTFTQALPDLCASYQAAVVDQLVTKTSHALAAGGYQSIGLSGGVANNRVLQQAMRQLADLQHVPLLIAPSEYTGDNAAMIAFAAQVDPAGLLSGPALSFFPRLPLV